MGRFIDRRFTVYKPPALTQTRIFAATRAVRKCELNIQEKCALLAELKQNADADTIAAAEQALRTLDEIGRQQE